MASLTHVCIWSEHGWKRITAEEAAARHPGGTVSAHSGLFMCDLCGQYVTLTDGEQRTRYFRHSAYETSKDCPERTFGPGYTPKATPGAHELPIRLADISSFSLELGMLLVPPELLRRQSQQYFSIFPQNASGKSYRYTFERLRDDSITYVSIGAEPAERYRVECSSDLRVYWPEQVFGISVSGGRLFHEADRKMLPGDADVQIGKRYYYLCTSKLHVQISGVSYKLLSEKAIGYRTWRIYEILPTALTEDAAKFFLERYYRLTDAPTAITPIWPLHTQSPFVIKHSGNELYFHICGGSGISGSVFPESNTNTYFCRNETATSVLRVLPLGRQQMISAGRGAKTLDYLYFWKEKLQNTTQRANVTVFDWKGETYTADPHKIPEKGILQLQAAFDGTIEVWKREKLLEKRSLPAEKVVQLEDLVYEKTVRVRQGLDIVWEYACEKRQTTDEVVTDERLLIELKRCAGPEISISHEAGVISERLNAYPKVKAWLRMSLRMGRIPVLAYRKLLEFCYNNKGSTSDGDNRTGCPD